MLGCNLLRRYCLQKEWAANGVALVGTGILLATIGALITLQAPLLAWVHENLLFNGLLLAVGLLLDTLLIFGCLCLAFGEDSKEHHRGAYRGRRTPLYPHMHRWIGHVGKNPRRRAVHSMR